MIRANITDGLTIFAVPMREGGVHIEMEAEAEKGFYLEIQVPQKVWDEMRKVTGREFTDEDPDDQEPDEDAL